MKIKFDEQNRVFQLDTENTSYLIGIADQEGFIGHIYYGKKISDSNVAYLMRTEFLISTLLATTSSPRKML